jgi:hypothetical protein
MIAIAADFRLSEMLKRLQEIFHSQTASATHAAPS